MKQVSVIVLLVFLTGCKSILVKRNNIKDPEMETQADIYHYLEKNKLDTASVLKFKSFNSWVYASQNGLLHLPEAMFYNNKGEYVSYKKSASDCNAKVWEFISEIKDINQLPSQPDNNIIELSKLVSTYSNDEVVLDKNYDGYAFITWAICLGRLNKTKAFEWVDLIDEANANGANIKYYLLNADLQESWELTDAERKILFGDE